MANPDSLVAVAERLTGFCNSHLKKDWKEGAQYDHQKAQGC
jgi:hypothetical protein